MTEATAAPVEEAPWLIQGGMGIAISSWPLARAVSKAGQLGVVSGTAIDNVFVRRLQDNGVDDSLRAVLDRFPLQSVVDDVVRRFGSVRRAVSAPYQSLLMQTHRGTRRSLDLIVLASFVEVALAKMGHSGIVGINLLTKVQLPTAATLCGAILAGVDYVLMGAGVPTHIPGVLDALSQGRAVDLPISVTGANGDSPQSSLHFDPAPYVPTERLTRPKFLGIVSSHVLAIALARRSNGRVDGFVVERPRAGGHNAPPRGRYEVDDAGDPVYGERDRVDYGALRELAVPFWIAGGITSPEHVREAFSVGASGVQVGTLFAFCSESGMAPRLRQRIITQVRTRGVTVRTSLRASSTGYPFKIASVRGTIAEAAVYDSRERKCDLGYLREAYLKPDGTTGYRCAAEPVAAYLRKGGSVEDTIGSACLCNGLMSTCGLGQVRGDGRHEPPVVTSGDCINEIRRLLDDRGEYSAGDVVAHLSAGAPAPPELEFREAVADSARR